MIQYNDIVDAYELFYSKVTGNPSYSFIPNQQQSKIITNFIKLVPESFTKESLMEYFAYHFSQRATQKTRFGVGIVMLNWVVSDKPYKSWCDRPESWKYHVDCFLDKYGLLRNINKIQKSNIEDSERQLYFNSKKGFINCIDNTTLFDNTSMFCNSCNFKKVCLNKLKIDYPDIYLKRASK